MARIAVFISGKGSNLQALIDACGQGELNAEIVCVFSNRPRAFGLERAARAGIPTQIWRLAPYRDEGRGRDAYDADLAEAVRVVEPDLIVLAGWMHILGAHFLDAVKVPVLNLHPALPGELPGTDAIRRAFEAHQRGEMTRTGVMVHHVVPEIDAGPVVGTRIVEIGEDDSLESLSQRMHAAEHALLVESVRDTLMTLSHSGDGDDPTRPVERLG